MDLRLIIASHRTRHARHARSLFNALMLTSQLDRRLLTRLVSRSLKCARPCHTEAKVGLPCPSRYHTDLSNELSGSLACIHMDMLLARQRWRLRYRCNQEGHVRAGRLLEEMHNMHQGVSDINVQLPLSYILELYRGDSDFGGAL